MAPYPRAPAPLNACVCDQLNTGMQSIFVYNIDSKLYSPPVWHTYSLQWVEYETMTVINSEYVHETEYIWRVCMYTMTRISLNQKNLVT